MNVHLYEKNGVLTIACPDRELALVVPDGHVKAGVFDLQARMLAAGSIPSGLWLHVPLPDGQDGSRLVAIWTDHDNNITIMPGRPDHQAFLYLGLV